MVADLVVLAIPFRGFAMLPGEELAGRIVLDVCNYLPYRDGHEPDIEEGRVSTSEVLAGRLPFSRVIKGLNTISTGQVVVDATPAGTPNRRALPIAGDDRGAKGVVARFIDQLGFDVVDAGPLTEARGPRFDPRTAWQPPLTARALTAALM